MKQTFKVTINGYFLSVKTRSDKWDKHNTTRFFLADYNIQS